MEILHDWEKKELKKYYERAINAGDYWKQKRKIQEEHQKELEKYLSKAGLNSMSEEVLKELLTKLWASGQFKAPAAVEKHFLRNNHNDFRKIIDGIKNLLYGSETLETRINTFSNDIKGMS